MPRAKKQEKNISIPEVKWKTIMVPLIGVTPLLQNTPTQATLDEIERKKMGLPKQPDEGKLDPEVEWRSRLRFLPSGAYGFPASGIRMSAVNACRHTGYKMVEAKGWFRVLGEEGTTLVTIHGPEPVMDRSPFTTGQNQLGIAYRPRFAAPWWVYCHIHYNSGLKSEAEIVSLFNTAGSSVGLGSWRVGNGGLNGEFKIGSQEELKALEKAAKVAAKKPKRKVRRTRAKKAA
jgi:hypothetical protein